jgi:hypothetical protein
MTIDGASGRLELKSRGLEARASHLAPASHQRVSSGSGS